MMLQSLASYAMRGPLQAILAVAGLALLSILFPPLGLLSAAVVALVALTQENRDSILIVIGASALMGITAYFAWPGLERLGIIGLPLKAVGLNGMTFVMAYILTAWLPTWLVAQWLKQTDSLAQTLLLTGLMGLLGVGILFVMMGNPSEWWSQFFEQRVVPALKEEGFQFKDETAREVLDHTATLMTGAMMAGLVFVTSLSVIIGRYWQRLLFVTGEFRQEFYQLRLGTMAASVAIGLLVLPALLGGVLGEFLLNASRVAQIVFLFQGLAVGHNLAARGPNGKIWLILLYVSLFFLPAAAFVLAVMGILDNWIDIRRRLPGAAS